MLKPIKNPFRLPRLLSRPQPHLSGRITPSGRFTLGTVPKSPPSLKCRSRKDEPEASLCALSGNDNVEVVDGDCQLSLLPELPKADSGLRNEPPHSQNPLGSSKPAISHKRGRRGCRGISSKASDRLMYWLSQMERRWGRSRLSFLTLTVPEVAIKDRVLIQENWSEIVRQFVQELKRKLVRRKAVSSDVLGCTEIQLERAAKFGWDVPHLHLVFVGRIGFNSRWLFRPETLRRLWKRILSGFISVADLDFRATENVQRIKFSVASYLGKYLSKSKSKCADATRKSEWHPSDYTILPKRFRTWYRANTVKGYDIALHILEIFKDDGVRDRMWMRPITIKTSIGEQVIGWVGRNPDWTFDPPDWVMDLGGH